MSVEVFFSFLYRRWSCVRVVPMKMYRFAARFSVANSTHASSGEIKLFAPYMRVAPFDRVHSRRRSECVFDGSRRFCRTVAGCTLFVSYFKVPERAKFGGGGVRRECGACCSVMECIEFNGRCCARHQYKRYIAPRIRGARWADANAKRRARDMHFKSNYFQSSWLAGCVVSRIFTRRPDTNLGSAVLYISIAFCPIERRRWSLLAIDAFNGVKSQHKHLRSA